MNLERLRKWIRVIHRDLGYFLVGTILTYAISGFVLNHLDDWDTESKNVTYIDSVEPIPLGKTFKRHEAVALVKELGIENEYFTHFYPEKGKSMKIFMNQGKLTVDYESGEVKVEVTRKRTLTPALKWMHYNPDQYWTWFSDIFSFCLAFLAISGLFMLKGKKGLVGRGAIIMGLGFIVPGLYVYFFYFKG